MPNRSELFRIQTDATHRTVYWRMFTVWIGQFNISHLARCVTLLEISQQDSTPIQSQPKQSTQFVGRAVWGIQLAMVAQIKSLSWCCWAFYPWVEDGLSRTRAHNPPVLSMAACREDADGDRQGDSASFTSYWSPSLYRSVIPTLYSDRLQLSHSPSR